LAKKCANEGILLQRRWWSNGRPIRRTELESGSASDGAYDTPSVEALVSRRIARTPSCAQHDAGGEEQPI